MFTQTPRPQYIHGNTSKKFLDFKPNANQSGFTLFDLMLAISISAILLGAGVPAMGKLISKNTAQQSSQEILHLLNYAREQALYSKNQVVVCPSENGIQCIHEWSQDWIIFEDTNEDIDFNAEDRLLQKKRVLKAGYTLKWPSAGSHPYIRFDQLGTTVYQNGRLYLCNHDQSEKRQLIVYRSGRIRYAKGNELNDSCG